MEINFEQQQQPEATTILNLPAELILQICSYDIMSTADILNLAISHSTLNNCLFDKNTSSLWKVKYAQKYDDWNKNEFKIVINEHNTWKDELKTRMHFKKAIPNAIDKLRSKSLYYKNIPTYLYPFGKELSMTNQGRQRYVYHATLDFYKRILSNQRETSNLNELYIGREFLKYVCHKYFGNMINNFSHLPLAEQTIEHGFYFVSRWWYPTHDLLYHDQTRDLDALAFKICNQLRSTNPQHPMFMYGYNLKCMVRNGQSNIDHDLYKEADAMIVLECISKVLFCDLKMLCSCTQTLDCYLLNKVLNRGKGSEFIMALLYESVARRLGILIKLVPSKLNVHVCWTSSWAGNERMDMNGYVINIINYGKIESAEDHLPSELLPNRNSFFDLIALFHGLIEQLFIEKQSMHKDIYDFLKFSKYKYIPDELMDRMFFDDVKFCNCPLFLYQLNPQTNPIYLEGRFTLYYNYEQIFPSMPNRRCVGNNPKYSIGMMVDVVNTNGNITDFIKRGVIVGWINLSSKKWNVSTKYYILILFRNYYTLFCQQFPVIESARDHKNDRLIRYKQLCTCNVNGIGKFFKYYDPKLCAFVPTDELAKHYPDDHAHTVSKMVNNANTTE